MKLNAHDYHNFLVQSMENGGAQWSQVRFFSGKTLEFVKGSHTIRPLCDNSGEVVRPESKEVMEAECKKLYDTVFGDDRMEIACEADKDFWASFHFGPKDDETCVFLQRLNELEDDCPFWISVWFHCASSIFNKRDEDGIEQYDDAYRFETLKDAGIEAKA